MNDDRSLLRRLANAVIAHRLGATGFDRVNEVLLDVDSVLHVEPDALPHTVKAGETLGSIAQRHGLDWRALVAIAPNGELRNPHRIFAGDTVRSRAYSAPDSFYGHAVALVTGPGGKASGSFLQRRLGIGYNTAQGLLDRMEREGLVGPVAVDGKRTVYAPGACDSARDPA